ncbi:MAG: Crp/Fnr family transcriptional regulator [Bacteroidales bacterium]|jgi:CRP-like cAMP-binding protein|nr:Crp/Fnr family transcriptional regulator [Bacteroidales bacterium]
MDSINQFSGCTISSYDRKCLDKLTVKEREMIDKSSVKINYKKGEMICKQGGFVSQIMYVEEGLAKVFIDNGSNSLLLRITPEGSFIGLSAISEEFTTFPYSAKVYVDTVIRQIDVKVFRQVLKNNNEFAREVINILSANAIQIYGRFFCLTFKQAYGRLADILLCLAEHIFKMEKFDLPLSRKDIAELSGMSSETVVRMLKKFNEDGLIKMSGKNIEVLDIKRLQHISETG